MLIPNADGKLQLLAPRGEPRRFRISPVDLVGKLANISPSHSKTRSCGLNSKFRGVGLSLAAVVVWDWERNDSIISTTTFLALDSTLLHSRLHFLPNLTTPDHALASNHTHRCIHLATDVRHPSAHPTQRYNKASHLQQSSLRHLSFHHLISSLRHSTIVDQFLVSFLIHQLQVAAYHTPVFFFRTPIIMTRVTPLPRDLAKLTRSVGSTIAAPRSSQIFNSVSWSAAARVRKEIEHGGADVPASEVSSGSPPTPTSHYHHPSPPHTPVPFKHPPKGIPSLPIFIRSSDSDRRW